ncbi:MAG: hypothetical protein Ct9H300mP7_3970 [Verrucomicrobiota bacterium]|nr:MAG: hypothetical protein Ct9H300mP7_3970 [Verrucomicrobiota bacterium]
MMVISLSSAIPWRIPFDSVFIGFDRLKHESLDRLKAVVRRLEEADNVAVVDCIAASISCRNVSMTNSIRPGKVNLGGV